MPDSLPASMDLHPRAVPALVNLMQTAEATFGAGAGAAKKRWVIDSLLTLAKAIDIPLLPDAWEEPIKQLVVSAAVELLWGLLFSSAAREHRLIRPHAQLVGQ